MCTAVATHPPRCVGCWAEAAATSPAAAGDDFGSGVVAADEGAVPPPSVAAGVAGGRSLAGGGDRGCRCRVRAGDRDRDRDRAWEVLRDDRRTVVLEPKLIAARTRGLLGLIRCKVCSQNTERLGAGCTGTRPAPYKLGVAWEGRFWERATPRLQCSQLRSDSPSTNPEPPTPPLLLRRAELNQGACDMASRGGADAGSRKRKNDAEHEHSGRAPVSAALAGLPHLPGASAGQLGSPFLGHGGFGLPVSLPGHSSPATSLAHAQDPALLHLQHQQQLLHQQQQQHQQLLHLPGAALQVRLGRVSGWPVAGEPGWCPCSGCHSPDGRYTGCIPRARRLGCVILTTPHSDLPALLLLSIPRAVYGQQH